MIFIKFNFVVIVETIKNLEEPNVSLAEKIYFVENPISKHQTIPGKIEDGMRKRLMKDDYKKHFTVNYQSYIKT